MSAPPTRGNQYPCRFLLRLYRFPDLVPPRFPYPLLWRRSRVPLSQSEPHLRSGREASTSSAGILRCRQAGGVTVLPNNRFELSLRRLVYLHPAMKVIVIIPAAGLGTRMAPMPSALDAKTKKPHPSKQFTELAGTPILIHTLRKFAAVDAGSEIWIDRKSTRLNSSHLGISYAVFC